MDKFLCALGVFDGETQKRLAEYQGAILARGFTGRQTMGIPFHVTLGTFSTDRREKLEEKLREPSMGPVELFFNHMGLFEGQEVLFLAPDVNRELLALKEHFGEEPGWTAHTTMLIDQRENALIGMEVLGERFQRFTGRLERAELWEFFPPDKLGERLLIKGR